MKGIIVQLNIKDIIFGILYHVGCVFVLIIIPFFLLKDNYFDYVKYLLVIWLILLFFFVFVYVFLNKGDSKNNERYKYIIFWNFAQTIISDTILIVGVFSIISGFIPLYLGIFFVLLIYLFLSLFNVTIFGFKANKHVRRGHYLFGRKI